jgi:hypothetical protein
LLANTLKEGLSFAFFDQQALILGFEKEIMLVSCKNIRALMKTSVFWLLNLKRMKDRADERGRVGKRGGRERGREKKGRSTVFFKSSGQRRGIGGRKSCFPT